MNVMDGSTPESGGPGPAARRERTAVFLAAAVRNLALGLASVEIPLLWRNRGLGPAAIGGLFALALGASGLGSAAVGLWAHRLGRRRLLQAQGLMLTLGGVALALGHAPWLWILAAATATFSPSGKDVGGMLPLEQAVLAEHGEGARRTRWYARYNMLASLAAATGALGAAGMPALARALGRPAASAPALGLWLYAAAGLVLVLAYAGLGEDPHTGAPSARPRAARGGLGPSRAVVLRLSALFAVDALAGGLVVQGLLVVWFHERYGVGSGVLGPLLFATNLAAAASLLGAPYLARRLGLVRTMVFTHLPSNLLLLLIPLVPHLGWAATLLVLRGLLSQLDVPTRQALTMVLVQPEERAAAAGLTASVRGLASSLSPLLSGWAMTLGAWGLPFVAAGGLKTAYDLTLFASFHNLETMGNDSRSV